MADDSQGGDNYELPPGPFVKIYGSIVLSSIWLESESTRLLWITMLAMADQNGDIRASVRGIAHTARISDEACARALAILEAPDSDSRDKRNGGRRIVAVDGGWHILNFRRYREMRTPDQISAAERQRRHREKQKGSESGQAPPLQPVTGVTVTPEVEGEVEEELKPVVAVNGDVTRHVTDAVRLTRMLNRGMADNPAIGQAYNPVIATSGHSHDATESLKAEGVPIEFAETWVYTYASAYKPKKPGDQISSLSYLVPAVIDAWQRANAKNDAAAAPLPPESRSTSDAAFVHPPAKPSGNGTYTLRAGEIINLIRSWRPPAQPETLPDDPADFAPGPGGRMERIRPRAEWVAPPPAWRADLQPAELRAVDAIGVDRIRSDEKPGIILAHLSKALGEAVRG